MADDAQLTHLLAAWRNDISSAAASGKRVLITGARGQVGLLALHHWLAAGAEVVALTRKAPLVFSHPRLSWVQGDLAEPASFNSLASTFPETLIFTAPIWFLPPLLPSLARAGVKRVVAFSSTSVHSKKTSGKSSERALATRLLLSEETLFSESTKLGVAATVLRPTLIYGIGIDKNVVRLAHAMRKLPFFPLPLNTRGRRQPVHAQDLALATLQAAFNPTTHGKAYDLCGGETLSYCAMLERIAAKLDKPVRFITIPAFATLLDIAGVATKKIDGEFVRRMGQDLAFDDSAARAEFGWSPRVFLDVASQLPETNFF